jgi:ribosomal protein L19
MSPHHLSRSRIDTMMDMRHPLAVLVTLMSSAEIEPSLALLIAHMERAGRVHLHSSAVTSILKLVCHATPRSLARFRHEAGVEQRLKTTTKAVSNVKVFKPAKLVRLAQCVGLRREFTQQSEGKTVRSRVDEYAHPMQFKRLAVCCGE